MNDPPWSTRRPSRQPSLPAGRIKERAEDFVVEEIPAYEASGDGAHVFVRFTKTDRTTMDAVGAMARALGCDPRAAGFAGMKDKRGVTTQTVSLEPPRGIAPAVLAERARALAIAGVTVHDARPHPHKIRPGHLAGNRFAIAVRGVPADRVNEMTGALDRIGLEGVPNAFGEQRYGRHGDNAARALAWLRGAEPGPRDPRIRRLLWSSVQSAVFDAVLAARVADDTWRTALAGDLLKLRSSGGLFLCADVQTDAERASRGEVSPTGPIIGASMRWPEGQPGQLERRICAEMLGDAFDFGRVRKLGEGTRRALQLWVADLRYTIEEAEGGHGASCVWVYFVLPKGAYATTVLRAAVDLIGQAGEDEESFSTGSPHEERAKRDRERKHTPGDEEPDTSPVTPERGGDMEDA
jgi:tRNA pseudouridine13 synthase